MKTKFLWWLGTLYMYAFIISMAWLGIWSIHKNEPTQFFTWILGFLSGAGWITCMWMFTHLAKQSYAERFKKDTTS